MNDIKSRISGLNWYVSNAIEKYGKENNVGSSFDIADYLTNIDWKQTRTKKEQPKQTEPKKLFTNQSAYEYLCNKNPLLQKLVDTVQGDYNPNNIQKKEWVYNSAFDLWENEHGYPVEWD